MSLASTTPPSAPSTDQPLPDDALPQRPRITIPSFAKTALTFPKPRSRHRTNHPGPWHTPTASPLRSNLTMAAPISPESQPAAIIHAFPSRVSGTTVYIVIDPVTEVAAIINPILDLDPLTNEIRTRSADRLLQFINEEGLTIKWILETALHSNRISACRYIQLMLRHVGDGVIPKVCVGENSFCTCGGEDDSAGAGAADESASSTTTTTTITSASQKTPDAFDKLFEDGEQLHLGNIVAQCDHLDDHAGVTYTFGQTVFGSGGVMSRHTSAAVVHNHVFTHAEPAPERPTSTSATTGGPLSSRQSMTIDQVLGSAERMSLNGSEDTPSPSPMLAFYAEQVNTRGGRIPKKINLPPAQRKASLGEWDSDVTTSSNTAGGAGGAGGAGAGAGNNPAANGKGKERERPALQPTPLRIPRKLGVIMC